MTKNILFFTFISFLGFKNFAQVSPENTNFGNPMDIPLIVAGNFGEVRSNHFHTGLDLKTQGVRGKKIKSIEKGYVSRIAFSLYGYGRVIYISHPNGYTSVYAHLSKFNSEIEKYIQTIQLENQKETFSIYLDSNEMEVLKGQVIAFSGNSGGSSAPHLHFEIRETLSENPMNPLLFGYKIKDVQKPIIKAVKIYPMEIGSQINGKQTAQVFPVRRIKTGKYILKKKVNASGKIGFAIHTYDKMNAKRNICGVYSIKSECNNETFFSHKMSKLDFSTNRFMNHHVDYKLHKAKRNNFHKAFLKGNNKLDIYSKVKDNGYLNIEKGKSYKMKFTVKDYAKNTSTLSFNVTYGSWLFKVLKKEKFTKTFLHQEANYFDTTNCTILLSEYTLYDDLNFKYKVTKSDDYLSDIHEIHNKYTAVQKKFKIILSPKNKMDSSSLSKALIVQVGNKKIYAKGGTITPEGNITTRLKNFGNFAIFYDIEPPKVELITDSVSLLNLTKNSIIKLKISDNLAGIESYNVYLDGNWIISNYRRKKGELWIDLSKVETLLSGEHSIEVIITDERGNESITEINIHIN